ncbi:MAG: hypothetical protein LBQ98_10090 [Nitrososphaerota archaeon]|jgi:hypothetical protein|nr:hypothetical protein [Nitrososphaerota archaeon]
MSKSSVCIQSELGLNVVAIIKGIGKEAELNKWKTKQFAIYRLVVVCITVCIVIILVAISVSMSVISNNISGAGNDGFLHQLLRPRPSPNFSLSDGNIRTSTKLSGSTCWYDVGVRNLGGDGQQTIYCQFTQGGTKVLVAKPYLRNAEYPTVTFEFSGTVFGQFRMHTAGMDINKCQTCLMGSRTNGLSSFYVHYYFVICVLFSTVYFATTEDYKLRLI